MNFPGGFGWINNSQLLFPERGMFMLLYLTAADSMPQNLVMRENQMKSTTVPQPPLRCFLFSPSLFKILLCHPQLLRLLFPFSLCVHALISLSSLPTLFHFRCPHAAAFWHCLNWIVFVQLMQSQQKWKMWYLFLCSQTEEAVSPGCEVNILGYNGMPYSA